MSVVNPDEPGAVQSTNKEEDLPQEFVSVPALEALDEPPLAASLGAQFFQKVAQFPYSPSRRLVERCQEIDQLSREANLPIRALGFGPLLDGTRILRAPSCDIALMPLEKDLPFQALGGKLTAPPSVKRDLLRIRDAGLDKFDRYEIARQLPDNVLEDESKLSLEWLLHPTLAAQHYRSRRYAERTRKLLGTLANAVLEVVDASVSLGAAVASLPLALAIDPMLIGCIEDDTPPNGEAPMCARFYLTHWLPTVQEV